MAKHGYVISQINVSVRNRPNARRPLGDITGQGAGLIELIEKQLHNCGSTVFQDDRTERAHRIEGYERNGWVLALEGIAGPYGVIGKAVNLDSGDERRFNARTANMNPLRAMFMIPEQGYDGLLFCERVGNAILRPFLDKIILREIGRDLGVTINNRSYIDVEAWQRFLDDASVQKITAVYRSTRAEDFGSQRGRSQDLKMVVGGPVARRLGNRLTDVITSVTASNVPVAYNIEDYPELLPQSPHYAHDHLELQVSDSSEQRTIVIERSELPQFTYVLGSRRPRTPQLHELWQTHGAKILSDLGATIEQ